MTAGPAVGTVTASTKKMPVPMVAPTPNIVNWNTPIVRASSTAAGVGACLLGHLRNGLAAE